MHFYVCFVSARPESLHFYNGLALLASKTMHFYVCFVSARPESLHFYVGLALLAISAGCLES